MLVEFALVIPVFILIVMGIVDLGRGIVFYNMLSDAAREGARIGIIQTKTSAQMCAQAVDQVQAPGVTSSSACSSIVDSTNKSFGTLTVYVHRGTTGLIGDPAKVQLWYSFQPITPIITVITGSAISLPAKAAMYIEP